MIVLGTRGDGEYIVTATAEELLRIKGEGGAVVADMFKMGEIIDVAQQWDKLTYFSDNAADLDAVISELRASADKIEELKPKGKSQ